MEHYQLKLFGHRLGASGQRIPTGELDFAAEDNLSAVLRARTTFSAAFSCSDYAVLRQRDVGVIWEEYADPPVEQQWFGLPAATTAS